MNIVVLDGYTLNPGDLSWDGLEAFGSLRVHDRTPPDAIVERAAEAEIVFTNKVALDRAVLEQLPKLQYIGVLATGVNVVDTEAAAERGIPVCNVPAYSAPSVAQLTFALLLELLQGVGRHTNAVRKGRWSQCPDFSFTEQPLVELQGMTLGLVGYGAIGRAVARIGDAFGMNVVAATRSMRDLEGAEAVSMDAVFERSDVVSLHCPLTSENRGLVDAARLNRMRAGAYLLNTARGALVNEADLAEALNEERIAGAGLDVLSSEPPEADNPLLAAKNCIITPHIAWATRAARERLLAATLENLNAFLVGEPKNVVNEPR
ncbi:MAG: D-2-hydroxyacid dehydrogenase [Opitutales bacterium]